MYRKEFVSEFPDNPSPREAGLPVTSSGSAWDLGDCRKRTYRIARPRVARQIYLRRSAEKNIPNCAGFSFGFKARGRRIVNYVTVIATQKLDDKDKQVGIFFDRNRLNSSNYR